MRTILLIVSVLISQFCIWAQGIPTATLHHGDELKTFYSATALIQAIAEAKPGDIINLSSGSFIGTNVNVPVIVRGIGIGKIGDDASTNGARTIITDVLKINVSANDEGKVLSMEGMECNEIRLDEAYNSIFSKMRIGIMAVSTPESKVENITCVHCIMDNFSIDGVTGQLYNCVLSGIYAIPLMLSVNNCLITPQPYSSSIFDNTVCYNCIINMEKRSMDIGEGYLYNCVTIGGDEYTYRNDNSIAERNNRLFPAGMKVFVDGTYYKLTDEGAKYLGSDGKQVGIYGGALPFSVKTNYPQIKKFTVAPESTSDGKLKIEIEIDADN